MTKLPPSHRHHARTRISPSTHILPEIRLKSSADSAASTLPVRGIASEPPRLSVIVCTFNRRNLVLATLATLREQTLAYDAFEVIIVDNGSTDGTDQAIHTYIQADLRPEDEPWQIRYLYESRNGLAHARNSALRVAAGEILVFLDDDTLVDTYFLERLLHAYDETGADVVGGNIELRLEANRPFWLGQDQLEILGYFAPFQERRPLPEPLGLSSCCFSLKRSALEHVGGFVPVLSKRLHAPFCGEVEELSQRLRVAGYVLWYEPGALVMHRVPQERLQRSFLIGRAYWQGRSEVLAHYIQQDAHQMETSTVEQMRTAWHKAVPDLHAIVRLALFHRPSLYLAHRRSTNDYLQLALARAYHWGRIHQYFLQIDRPPGQQSGPTLLLVSAGEEYEPGASCLAQAWRKRGLACTGSRGEIPLAWIWRHRALHSQVMGIIHCYRPGALKQTFWQRLHMVIKLRLARWCGIRVVSTDAGGWWQGDDHLRCLWQRVLEQWVFRQSHLIQIYSRYPDQVYPHGFLRQHTRGLPHPGMRGLLKRLPDWERAHNALGLSQDSFVYMCLANQHTEQEIIHLLTAFAQSRPYIDRWGPPYAQLVLVGLPQDTRKADRLLLYAANNPAIHLNLTPGDLAQYVGAADALVLPHTKRPGAGIVDMAMVFHSYGRIIITPNLPRLRAMLPPHACVFYEPGTPDALAAALIGAPQRIYRLKEKEAQALESEAAWQRHIQRLFSLYAPLLTHAND